jgi:predicted NBD/HSP70 family sugar kinase/biotin operon repressor
MKHIDNLSAMKRKRSSEILQLILANEFMTRNDIANATGYTMASVIKYTQLLVESGILMQESQGNGRTLNFRIATELGNIVAVIVGKSIQAFLVNPHGITLGSSQKIPFDTNISKENFLMEIDSVISEAKKTGGDKKILAIGLAIGGYINPFQGVSHSFYSTNQWEEFAITTAIEKRFSIPAFIMNDANAATLGEKYYGNGKGYNNFLLIWLGEGTGLGLIFGGELYLGASFYAGEIGHTHVSSVSELCYCGNTGCLETITSEASLIREYIHMNDQVAEGNTIDTEKITIKLLKKQIQNGDRFAQRVFTRAGEALSEKLADICNILNPEAVIFRGPIVDGNNYLKNIITYSLSQRILSPIGTSMELIFNDTEESPMGKGLAAEALLRTFI